MKNKGFMLGMAGIMLICTALMLYAGEFSDRFNPLYQIHGFDSPITTRDLMETGNFISGGDMRVIVEDVDNSRDDFGFDLLLISGFSKIAKIKVKFETSDYTQKNYLTQLQYTDLITKREEKIKYGAQATLDELFARYVQVMEKFYDMDKLLSRVR
jgi:hypothetical protein